jgi:hypothetical protein
MERENRWNHLVNKRTMTEDPVLLEMVRVEANVRPPRDYLKIAGVKINLTPEQVDQYEQEYAKFPVKETLTKIVQSSGYKNIKDDQVRKDVLTNVVSEFRSAAAGIFMSKDSKVTDELINKTARKAERLAGYRMSTGSDAALYNWLKSME